MRTRRSQEENKEGDRNPPPIQEVVVISDDDADVQMEDIQNALSSDESMIGSH